MCIGVYSKKQAYGRGFLLAAWLVLGVLKSYSLLRGRNGGESGLYLTQDQTFETCLVQTLSAPYSRHLAPKVVFNCPTAAFLVPTLAQRGTTEGSDQE